MGLDRSGDRRGHGLAYLRPSVLAVELPTQFRFVNLLLYPDAVLLADDERHPNVRPLAGQLVILKSNCNEVLCISSGLGRACCCQGDGLGEEAAGAEQSSGMGRSQLSAHDRHSW